MKKYIHVTREDREFLQKAFNVSSVTVWTALNFGSSSEKIRKIQTAAVKRGGIVMVACPEVETLHDSDNVLRQYLPNDTLLEFSKVNGDCDVYHKGERVRRYENVAVSEIDAIQEWAQALR